MSSMPRSLVSMTTGHAWRLASKRREALTPRESHASTTTSQPDTKTSTFSAWTPSSKISNSRNGSNSAMDRAVTTHLGNSSSCTAHRMRFMLESSITSKSASFKAPHPRSMASAMAVVDPTLNPTMPTVLVRRAAVSSRVIFSRFRLVRTSTNASSGNKRTKRPLQG